MMTYEEFYDMKRAQSDPPWNGLEPIWLLHGKDGRVHFWHTSPKAYGARGRVEMMTFREYVDRLWYAMNNEKDGHTHG